MHGAVSKIMVFRYCLLRFLCYFCRRKKKRLTKGVLFAQNSVYLHRHSERFGKHFVEGSAKAYLQIDESRQLIEMDDGIRKRSPHVHVDYTTAYHIGA